MNRGFGIICGVGMCLAATAAGPDAPRDLEGTWAVVRAERNGDAAKDLDDHVLTVAGDRFTIRRKDQVVYAGTITVDAEKKPHAIDFRHTEGSYRGKTWLGIFRRTGDRLTVCDNALALDTPRPTAFATKPGSGWVLVEFQRTK